MSALSIEAAAAISPLGANLHEIWRRVSSGEAAQSCVRFSDRRRFAAAECAPGSAADPLAYAGRFGQGLRRLLSDLNAPEPVDAIYLGTAVGALADVEALVYAGRPIPVRALDFAAIRDLCAEIPGVGPLTRFVCAPTGCCAGLQALGLAKATMPRLGLRRAIVASLDFALTPLAFQAFARIRATTEAPAGEGPSASRPFCSDRDGFLLADGGGAILVSLVDAEAVAARGGRREAPSGRASPRVTGYGCVSSAFHMTDIETDGRAIRASIERALRDAGRSVRDVAHVDLHGSGTRQNDEAEYRALKDLFGDAVPPVTAFKGNHGHALGGANLIEIALSWMMMREATTPPTAAGLQMDAFAELPPRSRRTDFGRGALLKTASGFGGIHAAVLMEPGDAADLLH